MRLVAGVARSTTRMVCRRYLWERLRLGCIGRVAPRTERRRVQLDRLDGTGVIGMLCLRPMAGFAVHAFMLPRTLQLDHVAVTVFTRLVAGIVDRFCCDLCERIPPIMPIAAEAFRHKRAANQQEHHKQDGKNCRKSKEVSGIPEIFHVCAISGVKGYRRQERTRGDLSHTIL